uniref:Uncharacterized protein n=1 Tax=Spongospora subterranea TaxID=70186 RepID=A0A0H5RQD8_9EUKA|eukprot:CRZ10924.1 hypothetical protein [Spongospora subterranea]
MDGIAGEQAIDHTLQQVDELLLAWSQPKAHQEDVIRSAAMILSWLRRLCCQNATRALIVADMLITVAKKTVGDGVHPDHRTVPSTKDRAVSSLDHREQSPQFWILDCTAEVLGAIERRDTIQDDLPSDIPSSIITYCFSRLSLGFSLPVQSAAGRCLSALSKLFLGEIISVLLMEMKKNSSDAQAREFVIVQRAVGDMDFCIDKLQLTVKYLEELASICTKTDRGVLRAEICMSLKKIMQCVLGPGNLSALETSEYGVAFWNVFARLYRIVGKWSKKSKHAVFCYSFMVTCVCLGQMSFFTSSNREDVFKLVIHGIRKEELRAGCLVIGKDYVRDVNVLFFRDDMDLFTAQIQTLLQSVMPKKKGITEAELPIAIGILLCIGRKHMHFLVNEVAAVVLKSKSGYTDTCKIAVLSALCSISNEIPFEMENYNYTLGPLVSGIIESDSEKRMMCAALSCFPFICHNKPERVKITGSRIAALTLDITHEVAVSASGALHRYAIRNPENSLLLSLYSLVDVLSRLYEDDISLQVRTISNVKVILVSYDEFILLNRGETTMVSFESWIAIRHHLEGICLLWLTHPEEWIRKEAWDLLNILSSAGIRLLDSVPTSVGPYSLKDLQSGNRLSLLVDYLKADALPDPESGHSPALFRFIDANYSQFTGVISWVWSIVVDHLVVMGNKEHSPELKTYQYPAWNNHLRFACLGARLSETFPSEFTTEKYRADYCTKKETYQSLRHSFVSLHLSADDITTFSQYIFGVSRNAPKKVWQEAKQSLSLLHSSVLDSIAYSFKASVVPSGFVQAVATIKRRPKRNSLDPIIDFFFHWRTLKVYELLVSKLDDNSMRNLKIIPVQIFEFTVQWCLVNHHIMFAECNIGIFKSMLGIVLKCCQHHVPIFELVSQDPSCERMLSEFYSECLSSDKQNGSPVELSPRNHAFDSRHYRRNIFVFITSRLASRLASDTQVGEKLRNKIHIASCNAISSLVAMGPISEPVLLTDISLWLESMNSLRLPVANSFSALLLHQPSQLLDFVVHACSRQNAPYTSEAYIRAVCDNISPKSSRRHFFIVCPNPVGAASQTKRFDTQVDEFANHPCTFLALSLLLQVSPSVALRQGGLEMASLLQPEFGVRSESRRITHDCINVCLEFALRTCEGIASEYFVYMPYFLDAVAFFVYHVSEHDARVLLRFVLHWVPRLSQLLSKCSASDMEDEDTSHCSDCVNSLVSTFERLTGAGPLIFQVLNSLFNLTRVIHSTFDLDDQLCAIWNIVGNQHHRSILLVVSSFLEIQFESFPELCRQITSYLLRSNLSDALVSHLLQNIRTFCDDIPLCNISSDFYSDNSPSVVDWSNTNMALYILTNTAFERPDRTRDFFPLMVHSASVLRHKELERLFQFVLLDLALDSLRLTTTQTALSFAAIVVRDRPSFARKWCKLAWDWAICCPDETVSRSSMELYTALNVWFDLRVGMHLSMRMRRSLLCHDHVALVNVVDLLTSIPLERNWTGPEWTLYIVLGFSLLAHDHLDVFSQGIRILNLCQSVTSVHDMNHIISDLQPLWSFASITSIVAKGFCSISTFASSIRFLLLLFSSMPNASALTEEIVIATMMGMLIELETRKIILEDRLVYQVITQLQTARTDASSQLSNLHRVIVAICSGAIEDARAVRRYHNQVASGSASRRSTVPTLTRMSIQGSRRISRKSVISNKEFHEIQTTSSNRFEINEVVGIDDLLKIVPSICRAALRGSKFTNPAFVLDLVESLLRSEEVTWRKPCLWLLDAILDELALEVTPRRFAQLGEILMQNCSASDRETALAAEVVCARLFDKAPQSYHYGAFKFYFPVANTTNFKCDSVIHLDKGQITESSYSECIRFFDGPVVSLISGLATLYIPSSFEEMQSMDSLNPEYTLAERHSPVDSMEFQSASQRNTRYSDKMTVKPSGDHVPEDGSLSLTISSPPTFALLHALPQPRDDAKRYRDSLATLESTNSSVYSEYPAVPSKQRNNGAKKGDPKTTGKVGFAPEEGSSMHDRRPSSTELSLSDDADDTSGTSISMGSDDDQVQKHIVDLVDQLRTASIPGVTATDTDEADGTVNYCQEPLPTS